MPQKIDDKAPDRLIGKLGAKEKVSRQVSRCLGATVGISLKLKEKKKVRVQISLTLKTK